MSVFLSVVLFKYAQVTHTIHTHIYISQTPTYWDFNPMVKRSIELHTEKIDKVNKFIVLTI